MSENHIIKRRRNLPHWQLEGSVYFVTFRVASGELSEVGRAIVLEHLRSGEDRFYLLAGAVIMPDHVHLIVKPKPPYDLSRIMKGIKGASARKINVHRGSSGTVWQDESWDRIIRDADEFEEKLVYMANNPVKAGLVSQLEDSSCWYCNRDFL